jgi:protein-tyrosine phosphatase
MERVLDRLWIGSAEDLRAPLRSLGFSAVLDLRDGVTSDADRSVVVHRVENRDGDPWSERQVTDALDFVAERVRHGRVLVACAAGMSRSACMIIGYLVRAGWDEASAHELVRRSRPIVAPVPKMLDSVLAAVRA